MLEMLADGLTAEETAHALSFARETVRQHRKAIYRKLGAVNAAHAVHIAHQEGLL